MGNEQRVDMISLFRQAATAMAAGILLVLIGTPQQLAIIGLAFCIYSFVLVIAAFIQIFPRCHNFSEVMGKFNDELTVLFIIVSVYSIFRNWAAITSAINNSGKTLEQSVLWVQYISSFGIPIWLGAFSIALLVVMVCDFFRMTRGNIEALGKGRGLLFTVASIIYVLGCLGVAEFSIKFNLALLILSLLFIIGAGAYIVWQKGKIRNPMPTESDKKVV